MELGIAADDNGRKRRVGDKDRVAEHRTSMHMRTAEISRPAKRGFGEPYDTFKGTKSKVHRPGQNATFDLYPVQEFRVTQR